MDQKRKRGTGSPSDQVKRAWKASGTSLPLKDWALSIRGYEGIGDVADKWLRQKRVSEQPKRRNKHSRGARA